MDCVSDTSLSLFVVALSRFVPCAWIFLFVFYDTVRIMRTTRHAHPSTFDTYMIMPMLISKRPWSLRLVFLV